MSTTCPKRRDGFAIVSAIFILVVLSALAGFVVSLTNTQNLTLAQDVQGARAYQAVRAGIDYGLSRWLGTAPSVAANCASVSTPVDMADLGFSWDLAASSSTSGGVDFCELIATARPIGLTTTNVGSVGYVERQLRVVVEGNPSP
jgi:MSHA biogenesis protein MshP